MGETKGLGDPKMTFNASVSFGGTLPLSRKVEKCIYEVTVKCEEHDLEWITFTELIVGDDNAEGKQEIVDTYSKGFQSKHYDRIVEVRKMESIGDLSGKQYCLHLVEA